MTGMTLLRPEWLLALPVIGLLGAWLFHRVRGLGGWQTAANPVLLQALQAMGKVERATDRGPLLAALGVAGLVVLALSGPAVERRDSIAYRNLDGVVLVLDASKSMTETASWTQAVAISRFAVASLGSRPGGLVVYGGDAYVVSDLTVDHLELGQTVSLVDENTIPNQGSRPALGLLSAQDLMASAALLGGDVVLITDGAGLDSDALQRTAELAGQGARVSVVSIDTPTPQLENLAAVGKGRVFQATEAEALGFFLQEDARTRLEREDYPLLFWKDFGRYLLVLALIPMLGLFRRTAA